MREKGRQEVEAAHFTTLKPDASGREANRANNCTDCINHGCYCKGAVRATLALECANNNVPGRGGFVPMV